MSDSLCKQKSHWIITINGKMNVWKCKLIFPTENTSVLIILATTVYIYTSYNMFYVYIVFFPCFILFLFSHMH